MSFDDLPSLPPLLHAEGPGYAERIIAASKLAVQHCRTRPDIPYGRDYWQKLDVYLPPEGATAGPLPVLCYVHGGAWANGCKEWMGFLAPALVDFPMVFVSLSHRLAPQVRMPEIVADCFDGLAWVYSNISQHGGDRSRIFTAGHSSGAHLAAILALRHDLAVARGLPDDVVKGCFPMSGTFDFRSLNPESGPVEAHILQRVLERPESAWEWSPLRSIEGNKVPFYVTWGDNDFVRVREQGKAFVDALSRQPGEVKCDVFANSTHFTVNEKSALADFGWARTVRTLMTA